MYNKIFTKILDSSIWLEPDATRIVWLTCIAAMDEDGFVQFASVANLARRANVSLVAAQKAVERLEGPDTESSDPENEGRRLERVQGGWIVLNAQKYRELVTREISKAQTRERVKRYREKGKVTAGNDALLKANAPVTTSEAYTETRSEEKAVAEVTKPQPKQRPLPGYRRLKVFRWMVEDLIGVLGAHLEGFEFDDWLQSLDLDESLVISETWPWLRIELIAECKRRHLPIAGAVQTQSYVSRGRDLDCPHHPPCASPGNWQCQQRTVLEQARAQR